MLARQIAGVTQEPYGVQSDVDVLLDAAGGGGASGGGGIQTETLNPQTPAGAATDAAVTPTSVPNVSTVTPGTGTPGAPADTDLTPLLWVGAGLGAAFLLSGGGKHLAGTVGKKKKSWLIPVIAVGGVAAWWFLFKKDTGATTATTDANRASVLSNYVGQAKQTATASGADSETLRRWALLITMWNAGNDPYKFDLNGNPTTNYAGSLGAWWELFAQTNGL